jgi:hypothetical protein
MRRFCALVSLAVLVGLAPAAAQTPAPAELLFERPQWQAVQPGERLAYRYSRQSPLEAVFGPAIEDRIRLTIEPGAAAENRTVRVEMFSETRRRAAGPFEDVPGNPAIVLFLEHHLENLARVLKANPRYLKNAIRAGLRDRAVIAPADVSVEGRTVPGWRVEAKPFADDPNKAKMRGLDTLTYTFVVADAVPGAVLSLEARATDDSGNQLLLERLAYDPSAR